MKIKLKKIISQEGLVVIGIIVLSVAFFNTIGSSDVAIWDRWMEYAAQNGILEGYALQNDMYPPLALILQIWLKNICPVLSNFESLRLINIFFLLVTVLILQVAYRNGQVSLLVFLGFMLSMNTGYLDIEMCPFMILAFYFLSKDKYVISGICFSLLCLVKFQPLIIMPYVCIFFVDIFCSEKHRIIVMIRWKNMFKIGIPAIIIGGGMILIYQKPLLKALYSALFKSGYTISANALNFGWIVQFWLEKFHAEIYGSLNNGGIGIIWNASRMHMQFKYIFIIIYVLSAVVMILHKNKNIKILLQCSLVGFTSYFLFNTGVHENHLFLGMVLMILLYLENPLKNNYYRMIMYMLIFNVNLLIFYGVSGQWVGYNRVINDSYDPTLIVAIFNVLYLTITMGQITYETILTQREKIVE